MLNLRCGLGRGGGCGGGALQSAERTLVCLRSRIALWEKYYYAQFDIAHYISSDVGFTNIVVWSMLQSGAKTKYTVPTEQDNEGVGVGNALLKQPCVSLLHVHLNLRQNKRVSCTLTTSES